MHSEKSADCRAGGCACGAIRFEINAPLFGTGACHCHKCQKASGGGPNYVALAMKDAFRLLEGSPKEVRSRADSGNTARRYHCADCGTPLWSMPEEGPFVPVKIGALDDGSDLEIEMHIYTSCAPPWHPIDRSRPCFEGMPPMGPAPEC